MQNAGNGSSLKQTMKTVKTHPRLEVIEEGFRAGVAAALKRHRLLGEKVAVLKDGRVQSVLVDELNLDEDGYPPGQNPKHANGRGGNGAH